MNHDCRDHLEFRAGDSVETHGLDSGPYEHFHDEWMVCTECGATFTTEEAEQLLESAN